MKILVDWLKERRISVALAHVQGNLLDVGCGVGNTLCTRYKNLYPERTALGVDVFPWEGVDKIIDNAASLPFPDESFDTVTCIAALNHIPERAAFLAEARRVLKPQGNFVMTMIPPFISRCWHMIIKPWDEDQSERGMAHEEVYGFSQQEISRMLQEAGFHIRHTEKFIFGLNTLYISAQTP